MDEITNKGVKSPIDKRVKSPIDVWTWGQTWTWGQIFA